MVGAPEVPECAHTCMQRSERGTVKWLLMGCHSDICVHTRGDLLPADLHSTANSSQLI